jgi:hypothetical protein
MRTVFLALLLLLTACGGSLSEEQRKKMRERMKDDEIKRITEGELMDASFAYGRSIATIIEKRDPALVDRALIDSLEKAFNVRIAAIQPGDSLLLGIEAKLIEAYTSSAGQVEIADDIQKIDNDSILYTKPLMRERPDGSVEFTRALSIHMATKSVVLSIED